MGLYFVGNYLLISENGMMGLGLSLGMSWYKCAIPPGLGVDLIY